MPDTKDRIDLTVVIPTRNEAGNIGQTVRGVREVCGGLGLGFEILVVDADSTDGTAALARDAGAFVIAQEKPGYGGATVTGFAAARGEWILTIDADLSHPPQFIERLWAVRESADCVIASRYVPGGYAWMPAMRHLFSRILNRVFAAVLAMPVRDMSSGFRLYRRESLMSIPIEGTDFNVLQNILVGLYDGGFRLREVPFYYRPRVAGSSNARIFRFGLSYLRSLYRLWKARNSITAADYDFRAFYSRHPFQRYWQRKRYRIIASFIDRHGGILDVGSGSSVFAAQYPGVTALDISEKKLRFLSAFNPRTVLASSASIPFPDASFSTVVCSEVIEQSREPSILPECVRVLEPGGVLIVGTPDYGSWQWPLIASLYRLVQPEGYFGHRINPYTRARLLRELGGLGLEILAEDSILRGEILVKARKGPARQ